MARVLPMLMPATPPDFISFLTQAPSVSIQITWCHEKVWHAQALKMEFCSSSHSSHRQEYLYKYSSTTKHHTKHIICSGGSFKVFGYIQFQVECVWPSGVLALICHRSFACEDSNYLSVWSNAMPLTTPRISQPRGARKSSGGPSADCLPVRQCPTRSMNEPATLWKLVQV